MQDAVVYLLQHEFELEGREESFMLGVFSDRQRAEEAQAYFETQPGFRDHLDGSRLARRFSINACGLKDSCCIGTARSAKGATTYQPRPKA